MTRSLRSTDAPPRLSLHGLALKQASVCCTRRFRTFGTDYRMTCATPSRCPVNVPYQTEKHTFYCCVFMMILLTSACMYWLLVSVMIIGYMEQIDRHSAEDEKTETMRCASVCRQSKLHDCPIMLAGASTAAVRELLYHQPVWLMDDWCYVDFNVLLTYLLRCDAAILMVNGYDRWTQHRNTVTVTVTNYVVMNWC